MADIQTYIDQTMIGDFPTALKSQNVHGSGLFWREVGESRVGDMVGLEIELVEGGEELGDGADALVGDIDTVRHGEADQTRVETGPESLLCNLIAAVELETVEGLKELH